MRWTNEQWHKILHDIILDKKFIENVIKRLKNSYKKKYVFLENFKALEAIIVSSFFAKIILSITFNCCKEYMALKSSGQHFQQFLNIDKNVFFSAPNPSEMVRSKIDNNLKGMF